MCKIISLIGKKGNNNFAGSAKIIGLIIFQLRHACSGHPA
jgi:hypothetical protein